MPKVRLSVIGMVSALWAGIFLAACVPLAPQSAPEKGTYPVDALFREFYASLGGQDTLGPAITALFNRPENQCQYTQNALLCFSPQANGMERYTLEALGTSMGVSETLDPSAVESAAAETIPVYEDFAPLYEKMVGSIYVGKPLTTVRFNPNRNRIEQYFENVGFYRNIDADRGEIHLLAYGVYACSSDCHFTPPEAAVVVPGPAVVEQPFLSQLVRLGGLTVFGMPLTEPYVAADGGLEQVYENVVMYSPANTPASMRLRSTTILLNIQQESLIPENTETPAGVIFYTVKNNLGHYVLLEFDHFIASHGGLEISGQPTSEVTQLGDGLMRQCFENYCLRFDSTRTANERVRLEPLGRDYMLAFNIQPYKSAPFLITPESVRVVVHAGSPRLPADQPQTFELIVMYAESEQPIANAGATLTLMLPGGQQALYNLPPTDAQGRTSLTIAPIQPPPGNGKVISFEACLNNPTGQPVCTSETYLIWNYQ